MGCGMVDITMCKNEKCPLKGRCYRYTAVPCPHWQSYFMSPEKFVRIVDGVALCDYFWDNGKRG